ncbi:hypothetical protein [Limnoglobus roseus]|uniref:Uncharacterized protein n=1 Tax=Limnoglobus roseus TaxID=2598579 RepID=A0A5C1AM10_9BACT|nr:hypothetical protein [Limnoglobus roseus]QEL19203.1 hypothetical protein PX52LOC_06263 [Limnoglobus roseus]
MALARRLSELRQGCSVLLLSEHRQLQEGQRNWLHKEYLRWADEIDKAVRELESGGNPSDTRSRIDGQMRELLIRS